MELMQSNAARMAT
jgi:hypothetical protein